MIIYNITEFWLDFLFELFYFCLKMNCKIYKKKFKSENQVRKNIIFDWGSNRRPKSCKSEGLTHLTKNPFLVKFSFVNNSSQL
jgi:hypothetical protein